MKTTIDPCKLCKCKYYLHGANGMCPPYNNYCATFTPMDDKAYMKATDLALAFEHEWAVRYADMKYFTVDCVVRDIAYHRKMYISSEAFDSLVLFLTKYIKEHPDRYQYAGSTSFRVITNSPILNRSSQVNRKLQSPN